jgi:hypothetical protein
MFFMHAFWKEQDEQAIQNQFAHFMKNVAMAGGALVIVWATTRPRAVPRCRGLSDVLCEVGVTDAA